MLSFHDHRGSAMKTSDQMRPSSRRAASGAWNRLKPVREDALDIYGLPSKGETRLNDFKNQEAYYNRIVERYMKFCASSSNGDDLARQFAALLPHDFFLGASDAKPPPISQPSNHPVGELSAIIAALRRLREAITATARKDQFAMRAYIFNIHAAILCRDWESYSPALVSLLGVVHPQNPLSEQALHEYVGYMILDLACRQGDIEAAHRIRLRYQYKDRRVELVLKALVADNWVIFWKMKKAVDGYQRRLMEFTELRMRIHALKCLGVGYLSADRMWVEACADRNWADLIKDGVGWELTEFDRVIIKRPKAK
ncbi:hypothetical protein BDV95DRAFT_27448 [Massariosphaeria phaeospora]|uniref:SAC3/GANP/Nin1/mts3/eIF-3 p25 family-domain-containing protein n=1 Tax=Massariosphaeria phaeospora TaxID=100035 RepID=A0A7C8I9U3_9PLEO|nr:hypothetical protein BDV95DRAFT_27448 [Massariosphaeria phaeospora]